MNTHDRNNERRNRSSNRGNGSQDSPSSTHPIRGAGGDFNRYSRSRSSYYTQKANEGRSSRSRRAASNDSSRSRANRSAVPRHDARDEAATSRYSRRNASLSRGGSAAPERSTRVTSMRDLPPEEAAKRYDSRATRDKYAARNKRKRSRRRIFAAIGGALGVLMVAGVAFGMIFMNKITDNFNSGVDSEISAALANSSMGSDPFYMLLLGIDSSKKRQDNPDFGGAFRSDTIILARIDPGNKKVTLVSIPRDTKVDLGDYGVQKINSASLFGGASLSIKTVSKLTGVPISHYALVNFDGFKDIVNALGGITVNVPIDINDPQAGGSLKKGKQTLNGKQALILCRSRHAYDSVGAGDYYRSANQRMVISAIAKKILKSDPATMMSGVEAISKCVTTDLSGSDFLGLLSSFIGFDSDSDMYTAQFPTYSDDSTGVSYEIKLVDDWKAMRDRMEQGLSPTESDIIDETTGTVMASSGGSATADLSATSTNHVGKVAIRNGSEVDGLGSTVGDICKKMGFTVDVGNANDTFDKTYIIYNSKSDKAEAKMVAEAIGCGKTKYNSGDWLFEGKFMVVIGKDFPQ